MLLSQTYRLIAGTLVLVSAALGVWVHPAYLWFTMFVGLNLVQSGITDWCPILATLRRAGLRG